MINKFLAIFFLFLSGIANAGMFAIAQAPQGGAYVALWDEKRMCEGVGRYAQFVKGSERVSGCWKSNGTIIQIAFLDGDVLVLPLDVFKKPSES